MPLNKSDKEWIKAEVTTKILKGQKKQEGECEHHFDDRYVKKNGGIPKPQQNNEPDENTIKISLPKKLATSKDTYIILMLIILSLLTGRDFIFPIIGGLLP